MTTQSVSQKELDRKSLAKKTYEARTTLLEEIGPRHGVKIYPLKKNAKDQMKSVFIRECKKHGSEEVKMFAFVVRGNFGCPHCARELQSKMFAQLRG
ncbi:hypothetical protein VPHK120G1_0010 [Vibrio phage K120 g1]